MFTSENITTPFTENTYDTPENFPRSVWEYLTLGTRASFYLRNFYVFYDSGKSCRANDFSGQKQADNAVKNFRIVESCGGKIHLRGLDNLSRFSGPAVIIGNHMSLLETALMHAFIRPRREFCFVIKRSLLDIPYFGDIMRYLGCIPVDRANPRDDFRTVMEEGKKRAAEGKSASSSPDMRAFPSFRWRCGRIFLRTGVSSRIWDRSGGIIRSISNSASRSWKFPRPARRNMRILLNSSATM